MRYFEHFLRIFHRKIAARWTLKVRILKCNGYIILGGISARYDLESIYIDLLWVADNSRHLGYGSQLLNAAEIEAQKFGCRYSTVDTYSFEAEGFYLKNGYERFGEIRNYWLHHSRIFLRKTLEKDFS